MPKLGWAADGLFQQQCRMGDWAGALETLAIARRQGHVEKRWPIAAAPYC